jgi:hypothetical protein
MLPAQVVTRRNSQIPRVRFARFAIPTRRVERSNHFPRCAVSTSNSITHDTLLWVLSVLRAIDQTVVALAYQFQRD